MSSDTVVSGRVVQPPAGPAADVPVRLVAGSEAADDTRTDGEPLAEAETDASGTFDLVVDESPAAVADSEPTLEVVGPGSEPLARESVTELVADGGGELDTVVLPASADLDGDAADATADGGQVSSSVATMLVGGYAGDSQMPHHGTVEQRGMTETPRRPGTRGFGRFRRLFDALPPATHDPEFLELLGREGGPMDGGERERPEDSDFPPAGYVFFGQFVDHDVTLDPTSSLDRQNDPDALRNFRTPGTDLDNVYGAGPEVSRHLYQRGAPRGEATEQADPAKFLLRRNDAGELADVPRNSQETALIGDPRNDENLIVSQVQCSMLSAHNEIVDRLEAEGIEEGRFEEAQQLLRWTYQWLLLNDFLPRVCDPEIVESVREEGREFYQVPDDDRPFVPLEFAGAAYRYGHSRIEERYTVNDEFEADLFTAEGGPTLRGFRVVPSDRTVDWARFFDLDGGSVQRVAPIDTVLPNSLMDLPFVGEGPSSLAARNLVRGRRLGLPSGQAVARAMGVDPLSSEAVGFTEAAEAVPVAPGDRETPLWFYVLGEAAEEHDGARLGPVGSRLVAETLVGLVDENPKSYRRLQPNWTPADPDVLPFDRHLTVGELLAFGR
ncbi:heme peroxidase family protein [Halobaculum sp. MBLA0147]|uniref:peroxidase family protein n=1 Tax=Halobaculum sp. MBLA0147 TaxID=3079934 RepID=UPI003525BEFE